MGKIPLDDGKMLIGSCIRHLVYACTCMKSLRVTFCQERERVTTSCQEGQRVVKHTEQCGDRTGAYCPICRLCCFHVARCKVGL